MNTRHIATVGAVLTLLAACGGKTEPAPTPTTAAPAPEPVAPASAAADTEPAMAEPATAKAPEPAPAAAPAEFTVVESPTLADIPDKPLYGKVIGKELADPKAEVNYSNGEWTIVVNFGQKESFTIPLDGKPEPPGVGTRVVRPKACCPGYLHHVPEGGSSPTSLNAPNGAAIEVTGWDVADWKADAGMRQPGGKVTGRLAVVYDADNWVAGTFETDFEYFGEPPLQRLASKDAARTAAAASVAAWKELPAPDGVQLQAGAKVWATSVGSGSWRFGEVTIKEVADGVVFLDGDRFTVPGLVRPMSPTEATAGSFVAAVDHLGPQFARVDAAGEKVDVTYLNPAAKPRTNSIAPARIFAWATSADGPGMPATAFFEREGAMAAGQAVAVDGADAVVVLDGGSGIERVPMAGITTAPGPKPLKKGQAVVAIAGCGMNGWMPRDGAVVEVLEGGVGYVINADPCKGVTVSGARLRAK